MKSFEGGLDRLQVFKNIGVIELEVVDDRDLRQVMDELAALIEKGGVVFVAFDDEPFAVGEARALAEILGNAADEITGIQPLCSNTQVSSEVVVVLPCVPETTSERFPRMKNSLSNSGREQ